VRSLAGAEIEQVIIDAMHRAFGTLINGQRRDFTTEDILRSIEETVPLAAIARDQIEDLKHWAAEAGARTASNDTQLVDELKHYTQQRGMVLWKSIKWINFLFSFSYVTLHLHSDTN
jgi:hypothetical protein